MADEITVSASLSVDKHTQAFIADFSADALLVDMSGEIVGAGIIQVGTTKENLPLPADLTTPGWLYLRNLEAEGGNYVSFGVDADTPCGEMKGQEPALFRIARGLANVSLKADTAAVTLGYLILED